MQNSVSDSYILMLYEPEQKMQVPILIGTHEAQTILLAQEGVNPRRPMTHQMMLTMMDTFGLTMKEVTIDRVVEGVFYATLHVTDGFNEKAIDSRTSDAVTLALLCQCPIMMKEEVIEETGVKMKNEELIKKNPNDANIEELEEELRRCEENEEYERAAEIQDEINRRREIEGDKRR